MFRRKKPKQKEASKPKEESILKEDQLKPETVAQEETKPLEEASWKEDATLAVEVMPPNEPQPKAEITQEEEPKAAAEEVSEKETVQLEESKPPESPAPIEETKPSMLAEPKKLDEPAAKEETVQQEQPKSLEEPALKVEIPMQPGKPEIPVLSAKATEKNFGKGTLELLSDKLVFQVMKGGFRKRKEAAIRIPFEYVESVKQEGNRLIVVWNSLTDTFSVQKPEAVIPIAQKMNAIIEERAKVLEQPPEVQATKQEIKALPEILNLSLEMVDSLFDCLRGLHGKINWATVASHVKVAEEKAEALADQKPGTLNFSFKKLNLTVMGHLPEDSGKEAFNLLKAVRNYYVALAKDNVQIKTHPNLQDAQTAVEVYFVLSDVLLGSTVEDEDLLDEGKILKQKMEEFSKSSGTKVDLSYYAALATRLNRNKEREGLIAESRTLFKQQIRDLFAEATVPIGVRSDATQIAVPASQ